MLEFFKYNACYSLQPLQVLMCIITSRNKKIKSIPVCKKLNRHGRWPNWLNKELLTEPKKKKSYMEGRKRNRLPMWNKESPRFAAMDFRMARMWKATANILIYLMNLYQFQICPPNLYSKRHEALLKFALRPLFIIWRMWWCILALEVIGYCLAL